MANLEQRPGGFVNWLWHNRNVVNPVELRRYELFPPLIGHTFTKSDLIAAETTKKEMTQSSAFSPLGHRSMERIETTEAIITPTFEAKQMSIDTDYLIDSTRASDYLYDRTWTV